MDGTTLKENITGYLADHSAITAPVRTSGMKNDRPVPGIILDDWSMEDLLYHNTQEAQHRYKDLDGDGEPEVEKVYRFHYEARLEFVVRADDEVEASQLADALKEQALRDLQIDPCQLHDHVKWLRPVNSGDPTYHFGEPKETEEHVGALLESFVDRRMRADDFSNMDPIEVVQSSFSLEGNEFRTDTVQ